MIVRPTTEQILVDCSRVLQDILGTVSDETAQVRIVMLQKVLQNAAIRSAHEIAWMFDEIASIEAYARAVVADADAPRLRPALDNLAKTPRDSFHLDDVAETYCRAGDVLSAALEVALAGSRPELVRQGESLLEVRLARENEIVGGWDSAGR
jgi:hypothetical protein